MSPEWYFRANFRTMTHTFLMDVRLLILETKLCHDLLFAHFMVRLVLARVHLNTRCWMATPRLNCSCMITQSGFTHSVNSCVYWQYHFRKVFWYTDSPQSIIFHTKNCFLLNVEFFQKFRWKNGYFSIFSCLTCQHSMYEVNCCFDTHYLRLIAVATRQMSCKFVNTFYSCRKKNLVYFFWTWCIWIALSQLKYSESSARSSLISMSKALILVSLASCQDIWVSWY